MRVSKVTTKTGDKGQTDLGDGTRVSKNNLRIELIGSIDHLNSIVGWSLLVVNTKIRKDLQSIQQDLFNIGAELSIPDSSLNLMKDVRLIWLDKEIKKINSELPPLKEFILPGGSELSSRIHIARTECRKVERNLVSFGDTEKLNQIHLIYFNRLSDYFFVLARKLQSLSNDHETQWDYKK
tara:strand:- start:739 stop:1281 length:543 start_codon:yes stop_codon:yes gene_type:complete